jgi:lipoyl(octanoyl) transferase
MTTPCLLLTPGLVDYQEAWDWQRRLVESCYKGESPEALLLLEHPHTYTLGRSTDPAHMLLSPAEMERRGVRAYVIDRGGDVTYHGPGQLVGYPILDLRRRGGDLHRYLRDIEEVLIRTVGDFGIQAGRIPGLTGVWVGMEKIAAIGIKVTKGISSHGFALNVAPDLSYFGGIIPCGITDKSVTSLTRLLNRPLTLNEVTERLLPHFTDIFDVTFTREKTAGETAAHCGPEPAPSSISR